MQPLEPGDPRKIGGYQLRCLLGQGGMGRVYLGHSLAGKWVAVKIIQPEHASDQDFLARFRREVEAAKRVSGAFTASVLEAGPNDRPPWLVTEYVPGPSLAEAVAKVGRLPIDAVWRLAAGLVEALAAVHACDLVHRDLKPGNVLLAADGPKVIDFGISKSLSNAALARSWTTLPNVTVTGGGPGTPGFMAPEQRLGSKAGPESDVYALGKVITYAATGSVELVNRIGMDVRAANAAAWSQEFADIPGELRGLVARCLSYWPTDRPTLEQLMEIVVAGTKRYPQASPLSFWREPLAGVIRDKVEELRSQLGGDPQSGQWPAQNWAGGTPHPPTRDSRDHWQDGHGYRQPGFEPTQPSDRSGQPGYDPGFGPRGTWRVVDDSLSFGPTQGVGTRGSFPGSADARRPVHGSAIARGLSGAPFAPYRPRLRRAADRRSGSASDAAAYALEGDTLFGERRHFEAEERYRRSIELEPKNPALHVDLGRTYFELQRLMDAEASFLQAIELDSLLIAAHRNRYLAVDMMTGRLPELPGVRDEAQAACEEVLGLEVRDPAGLANLGDAYCCLSRYGEALSAYERALSLDADNARLIAKRDYARRQSR